MQNLATVWIDYKNKYNIDLQSWIIEFSTAFSKIEQNNGKSHGDLRRLAVAQTPVKDH